MQELTRFDELDARLRAPEISTPAASPSRSKRGRVVGVVIGAAAAVAAIYDPSIPADAIASVLGWVAQLVGL